MVHTNGRPEALDAEKRKEALTHSSGRRSRLSLRQALVLVAIPILATSGNTLLAIGMRHIGRIGAHNWRLLFAAVLNPYIVVGILLLIGFFGSYLSALGWADLTYVIPTTSFGYILVPLASHIFLNESISTYRWLGVALISCSVIVGSRGPVRTGPKVAGEEA